MSSFFKNQLNLFMATAGITLIIVMGWYFGYHQKLSTDYVETLETIDLLTDTRDNYRKLQNNVSAIENEWKTLNDDFQTTLGKIPTKSQYDNVSNSLYSLLTGSNLTIKNYSPSALSIETKTITMPETNDQISIEKIPIDVTVRGNYINFGRMMEQMGRNQYRFTISNIELNNSGQEQDIQFIAYAYFQSSGDDQDIELTAWQPTSIEQEMISNVAGQEILSNKENQMGGIVTMPWKGEEVIVGIDNPQYTTDGLEIYAIEYSDGKKEFVDRSKLPPELFNETKTSTENVATIRSKQEVLQIKTQFSDQLEKLEKKIKGFKSIQEEQQQKYEQELTKAEQENQAKLDSIQQSFEKQLALQEKKISVFEEQEKIKDELKKLDQSKAELESKSKLEALRIAFDTQLREQQGKFAAFEALQSQQRQEMDDQKRKTEQDNKAKLESLQREFETQLQQQQEKISAFEALQVQQNKEKQNQEATNKKNQLQLQKMQREFETQLQQQQEKISAFEALQDQQQQEMAEQKALAKQASKEKLSEIQREFVNQLEKKEKQIANISNQFAANPAQKAPAEKQKPELTSAEKKAMQKKEMKEFMTTLKQLEAQEKKAKQQKLQTNNIANRIVAGPIKRIVSTPNPSKIIPYENLDHVFKNLSIDGVYRFGNLGKQSDLIIITTGPEPIAQLKSRYWVEPDVWKNTYRNLKNVRIEDDKLFSTEYIGEFVFYEKRGELIKGLRIQKSGAGNLGSDSDVGKRVGSIAEYYEGDFPYTSTRILSKLEIENMSSRSELKLMRNEIFARYGHKFEPNGRMDQHFTNKNWYQPQHEDVTAFLTDIEIKNVNQIKNTEVEVIEAINFLKGFAN
jgi:hypothetical protein